LILDNFFNPEIITGSLYLDEEESKHCIRVLRKKVGDEITILDGKGGIHTCRITNPHPKKTEFEIIQKRSIQKPVYSIHIAIAPTKNMERIEWFLEKSIETGIQSISFIHCENSQRRRINMDRMTKKAINAVKQSQNAYLVDINDLVSFNDLVMKTDASCEKFICHAIKGEENYLLHTATIGLNYLVLVGPEGDFTNDEIQLATKMGFEPVSLGNTRLRTETAGFVACALLNALNIKD